MADQPAFNTLWDAAVFHAGPASIFVVDHKNWLKVDPERTRELWLLVGELPRTGVYHGVLTDHKTGLKMYLCATHERLLQEQPHGVVERVGSASEGLGQVAAQWLPAPDQNGSG